MSEEPIPVQEEQSTMSVTDKFVGILSSPAEVYDYVAKGEPQKSNWVIPYVLAIVLSIVFTFFVFSQPPIQDEMIETQNKAMQKNVADGKMTQEQADKAMEMNPAKPGSPMFLIFGSVGVVLVMTVMVFAYPAVYWIGGKILFKATVTYSKILEVYGLSMYVICLSTIVTMIMAIGMGSLYAQPALSLLVSPFDPMNTTHKLLAAVNILSFWHLFVVTVGVSKVWNVEFTKALMVTGGVWIIWTLFTAFMGFGM
jgi:hypothetical protein